MKTLRFLIFAIALSASGTLFFACVGDEGTLPITLKDRENTTIRLTYPNTTTYYFPLQGGDGNFSVTTGDPAVVSSEIIRIPEASPAAFQLALTIRNRGTTQVIITDRSENALALDVIVDYQIHGYIVKHTDIAVFGGDLTGNQKKAISEKYLGGIPVKVDGGYQFIFTGDPQGGGKAVIYPDVYGINGVETTFTIVDIAEKHIPESLNWGYETVIDGEKRIFVLGRYVPSTKMTSPITSALMEDVTLKVREEYPAAEFVYTSQVIQLVSY